MQYNILSWIYFGKLYDENAFEICAFRQCSWHVIDLDLHSQKCLSHNLINYKGNRNSSAVTSVVQPFQLL